MLTVKLRDLDKVKAKLVEVEEDGKKLKHTDGVLFKASIYGELAGMSTIVVKEVNVYGDNFAFGVVKPNGAITYINPKWVTDLTDGTLTVKAISNKVSEATRTFMDVNASTFLNKDTLALIKKDSVKVCVCCGAPIENDADLRAAKLCRRCYIDKNFKVHNYSFKPAPDFTGAQLAVDVDNPIWFGVELEYGIHSKMSLLKATKGQKLYFKADTSIKNGDEGGVEVVTHPHSFSNLMGDDSWVNKIGGINCNSSTSNGCHIHVGRTAWATDKHYALTHFLMFEMGNLNVGDRSMLEHIGGRKFTGYCDILQPTEKIHQVKKDGIKNGSRSVWLNENNAATIEFRFFGGTNDPKQVKRYVQLLEAVIKYTKHHAKTVSVNGLVAYVKKYKVKYAELFAFLEANNFNVNATVTYTQPKKRDYSINKLPITAVADIISMTVRGATDPITDVSKAYVDGAHIYYSKNNRGHSIKIALIISVTTEG